MVADCKLLEQSRDLLNELVPFKSTTFKLVRRKKATHSSFSLLTYDNENPSESRFLMATRRFVSMANTIYPVSIISKVTEDVCGSLYEVGHMISDFVRNSYHIHSYRPDAQR
jgi:hypothetical protein